MNDYIITFKGESDIQLLEKYGAQNIYVPQHLSFISLCKLDDQQIERLKNEKSVLAVEKDKVDRLPNDVFDEESGQGHSYAIDLSEVKRFHELGFKGQGVKVAIFDSGVQKHEDLVIAGGINAHDPSKPYDANLDNGHGTKVAGIIGMQDNGKGYLGVAPECELYAVRIDNGNGSDNGTQWSEQIIGMNWAIENNIDVINCSFSGVNDSVARRAAFKAAHDAGIAIFCSAGNRQGNYDLSISRIFYPSKYPFVITVANINPDKTRYSSSSVGRYIDFAAGGVNVTTTDIDTSKEVSSKYSRGTGTSYAAPVVAGIYCLYKNMFPNDSREKLLQRMYVNAERIGSPCFFGAGIPKFPDIVHENIVINERVF